MSLQTAISMRELSGITPSGPLTLGNYLGALRRFRAHQDNGFYFVANLHALTTDHRPARLRELTLSTAALFLATGLDPDTATVFLQSDVPAHVELAYLLESTAHVGELSRMIQFKEKGGRPGTRASLFTYPCLMAADILLYDADRVPVGGDQSQHVELTRDLAQRFNTTYGPTFTVPELVPEALSARVRDLADPTRKMSKSAPPDAAGVVRILDSADVIRRKIRRAVTDGDNRLHYDPHAQARTGQPRRDHGDAHRQHSAPGACSRQVLRRSQSHLCRGHRCRTGAGAAPTRRAAAQPGRTASSPRSRRTEGNRGVGQGAPAGS